jgi:hypothetical protein
VRGYRWVVLGVIILASFVAYVLRTNVSIIGEAMMLDLGMTEYQLGLVFSAFAAGYAIFQFPGGMIGDRFGPRRTIAAIAIAWTLLTVATALIPGSGPVPDRRRQWAVLPRHHRRHDRALVPGQPVGPAQRPVEHRADPGRRNDRAAGRLAHGELRLAQRAADRRTGRTACRIRLLDARH